MKTYAFAVAQKNTAVVVQLNLIIGLMTDS